MTERSEGAPKQQSKVKERHMHYTLRYGTLLMVLQVGARDRMENVLESVVIPFTMEINFPSKVYSKSLLKGLHKAKPIDLYFDAG